MPTLNRHLQIGIASLLIVCCTTVASAKGFLGSAACPLCPAIGAQTIGEELETMDVIVFAALTEVDEDEDGNRVKGRFLISEILAGEPILKGQREFEVEYYGLSPIGTEFIVAAIDPANLTWSVPIRVSERSKEYVRAVENLPDEPLRRLEFFRQQLEDEDDLIATDAYDEFARAPYDQVVALKSKYDRSVLIERIQSDVVPDERKRLYFMLLGICGTSDELPLLEKMLRASLDAKPAGLDSMIACYLSLAGENGMALIDELFIINEESGYAQTYAAIMALRFHGTDADVVPLDRVVQSFRRMLGRPTFADLIIPDLCRWEDWESAERLLELFRTSGDKYNFVRIPIVIYMQTCPLPRAAEYLEEIKRIDPVAVKRAEAMFPFGG